MSHFSRCHRLHRCTSAVWAVQYILQLSIILFWKSSAAIVYFRSPSAASVCKYQTTTSTRDITDGGQPGLCFKVRNVVLLVYQYCYCCLSELLSMVLCLFSVFRVALRFVPLKSRQSLHRSCLTEACAWARGCFWWQNVQKTVFIVVIMWYLCWFRYR